MSAQLSEFARSLNVETAFTVLAVAKKLKAAGKDVVELEIGDSPFNSTASAIQSGLQAIHDNQSHYCPSPGIPEFREAAATFLKNEFSIPVAAENIAVGPGAKVFEQFFCEAFLGPGDGCLVRSGYRQACVASWRRIVESATSPTRHIGANQPHTARVIRRRVRGPLPGVREWRSARPCR